MIDFATIARDAHATAVEKGWYEKNSQGEIIQRDFSEVCALFHSEISEAVEELRAAKNDIYFKNTISGQELAASDAIFKRGYDPSNPNDDHAHWKPEGAVVELADLIIRLGDTTAALGLTTRIEELRDYPVDVGVVDSRSSQVGNMTAIHKLVSILHDKLMDRFALRDQITAAIYLLVRTTEHICSVYGWDLENAIKIKMAYNKTRSFRHGGKKA